jgi:hypothetical protein
MVADPGRVPNVKAVSQNGFTLDMFGRLKIGEGFALFDSQHRYRDSGQYSDETNGTASSTYLPNESTVALAVGTASGDRITRESRRIFPYQPGKSLQIMQTFVLNPAKANLRQRVGYFSRQNGIYLEQDGLETYLVIRSYASGQVVNNRVAQADWNVERLMGDGKTDYTLDLSKGQIMFIEVEWLGVGSVRVGFMINGVAVTVHRFDHANYVTSVYMTTSCLPVRYEIENTGNTASASTMKQICTSVISNGGFFKALNPFVVTRPTTTVSNVYYPLVALRLAPGREDAIIIPAEVSIFPTSADDFDYALLRNPDSLTGGTWVTHPQNDSTQYNITATAMTGGSVMLDGFFGAENQSASPVVGGDVRNFGFQLGRTNAEVPVSDVVVLAVKHSTTGSGTVKAQLGWYDLI